jgi:hypothetical protein
MWILFASYPHVSVYSQKPFIRIIRFIFSTRYSHRFAYKYSIDVKNTCCSEYSLQSEFSLKIFSYWRIFASKYSLRSEYSQNLERSSHSSEYFLANIRIQAIIRLQIFAYQRIFATNCFNLFRKGVHSADQWAPTSTFQTSMCYTSTALYFNREWLKFRANWLYQKLCRSTALYINKNNLEGRLYS